MTPRELELRTNLFADLSEEEFNEVIKHRREEVENDFFTLHLVKKSREK